MAESYLPNLAFDREIGDKFLIIEAATKSQIRANRRHIIE